MIAFEEIENVRVLVVGDVMLDRYWWGDVTRISPEAPVPVVSLDRTSLVAGGAANVAANIAGLGGIPTLIGITGEDDEASLIPEVLNLSNIQDFRLFPVKERKTTLKTRIVANSQQVARIDHETTTPLSPKESEFIFGGIQAYFPNTDLLVISDYAKGFLTDTLLSLLIENANANGKMILVDPKGKDYSKYRGATMLTPNERETANACGLEENRLENMENAARKLLDALSLQAMIITRGAKGMTLLEKDNPTYHLPATARKVFDVTGAGDTVIAAMAVALGSGMNFLKAAEFANLAAGLVVQKVGTTAVTSDMIREYLLHV